METIIVSFGSLSAATAFTDAVFETPLLPAAVEIMNHTPMSHLEVDGDFSMDNGSHAVAVGLEAFTGAVDRMRGALLKMAAGTGAIQNRVLEDDDHRRFWQKVSMLEASQARNRPDLICLHLTYPISAYITVIRCCTKTLSTADIPFSILTHAGSGMTLLYLLIDRKSGLKMTDVLKPVHDILEHCADAGGNLVVSRAPPEFKASLPIWGRPGADISVMKRIKARLDPKNIMSPGRFI